MFTCGAINPGSQYSDNIHWHAADHRTPKPLDTRAVSSHRPTPNRPIQTAHFGAFCRCKYTNMLYFYALFLMCVSFLLCRYGESLTKVESKSLYVHCAPINHILILIPTQTVCINVCSCHTQTEFHIKHRERNKNLNLSFPPVQSAGSCFRMTEGRT